MNIKSIAVLNLDDNNKEISIAIADFPNECPICHHKIQPQHYKGFMKSVSYSKVAEIIFLCPDNECMEMFIGYYRAHTPPHQSERFNLYKTEPKKIEPVEFSDIIKNVSFTFPTLYNQANTAEEIGLKDICGAGYRKALEFLVKDYIISKDKENEEKVKKEQLGTVIKNRVEHAQLKEVAKRATWLGNDETHYERRWEEKDLKDLKLLIGLAVRWIETDKMTEEAIKDMPENN